MSCENNTPLASRYDDLFLKSSGPFFEILTDQQQQIIAAQEAFRNSPDTLIDQLIANGGLDTGSGLGDGSLRLSVSDIFDNDGNLRPEAVSSAFLGAIDPVILAGGYDDTSEIFKEIKSFASKLDLTTPTERFGSQVIIDLTNALNNFIKTGSASGGGGNSNTGVGTTGGGTVGGQPIDLSDYPSLEERVNSEAPDLSFTEVGNFLIETETDPFDLLNALKNPYVSYTNNAVISKSFSSLNTFFLQNLGAVLSSASGLCGAIADIFELIISILDLLKTFIIRINTGASFINAFINDPDFRKLVIQNIQKQIYQAVRNLILDIVDQIYELAKQYLLSLLNSAISILRALTGQKQKQFTTLEEAYVELDEFFSKENLEKFKKKIKDEIDKLALEFERFTIENIAQLIYRLCKFIEQIQQLLFGPLFAFQNLMNTAAAENEMMRSISLINTKRVIEHGGLRLSLEVRKQLQEQARKEMNDRSATFDALINGASTDYATAPEMTNDEIELLFGIKGGVQPYFNVSGSAKEPYRPESPDITNLMRTRKIVLARLIRMSKRTDITYTVIEAFLLKEDEENIGAKNNTVMNSGSAIKIKIEGDFRWVAKTIISASQEGFVGIGVGKDYIHLDVGPRELTWVDGYTAGFTDADAVSDRSNAAKYVELLERHKRKEFVKKVL